MYYQSPLGPIFLHANHQGLTRLTFQGNLPCEDISEKSTAWKILVQAQKELDEYIAGARKTFDVPLHITGGTSFQQRVWKALLTVPYGETCSYTELAKRAGTPKAVRAVGQANKANPIALIIPCHRVIGKSGQLTGYMGASADGIAIKKSLLQLEQGDPVAHPKCCSLTSPLSVTSPYFSESF